LYIFFRNFNSRYLRIYATWQVADVELPDGDMKMSKHVGMSIM